MKNGTAATTWSSTSFTLPVRINSQLIDQSLFTCSGTLMCRIQHGEEVPHQLADGEVFIIPKQCGSGPDFMRFVNLLDSTGKLLFGYWLSYVLDQPFGFTDGRGVPDCLAIRYAAWERAGGAGCQ